MRQEVATSFAQVPGKAQRQMFDGNVFVYFVNAVADRSITFFLVQSEDIASTIVYFDKVEAPVAKV